MFICCRYNSTRNPHYTRARNCALLVLRYIVPMWITQLTPTLKTQYQISTNSSGRFEDVTADGRRDTTSRLYVHFVRFVQRTVERTPTNTRAMGWIPCEDSRPKVVSSLRCTSIPVLPLRYKSPAAGAKLTELKTSRDNVTMATLVLSCTVFMSAVLFIFKHR